MGIRKARLATAPGGDTSRAVVSERIPVRPSVSVVEAVRRRWFELGVGVCFAAVAAFLLLELQGWPPHEDETLALFVGRQSLGNLLSTVLGHRGGAPLHFVLAWIVAHSGGGLGAMRLVSALFAIASVPVIAALS